MYISCHNSEMYPTIGHLNFRNFTPKFLTAIQLCLEAAPLSWVCVMETAGREGMMPNGMHDGRVSCRQDSIQSEECHVHWGAGVQCWTLVCGSTRKSNTNRVFVRSWMRTPHHCSSVIGRSLDGSSLYSTKTRGPLPLATLPGLTG